ncbi:MAG: HNH endonuclease [Muribaculaceae bacterium]|nr:HNH endonuclease [Muribaculaceae bacterium]
MAHINKKTITTTNVTKERQQQRQHFYNKSAWQKLRKAKLMAQPLCEMCGCPAVHVHHLISFLKGDNQLQQMELLLDWDNLMSVCHKCHNQLHNNEMKGKKG